MRNSTLYLALFLTTAAAQTPSTTTTYHSDELKLDFTYPSSFTPPKSDTPDEAPAKPEDCVATPVSVMDMRTSFNMIFVRRYNPSCPNQPLTAKGFDLPTQEVFIANAFVNSSLETFGKPTIKGGTSYELAGHHAYVITGSVKAEHSTGKNVLYSVATCVISGKNIGCFNFISNDCKNLATMVANPITFEGAPAEPAIPAKTPIGCKP
jgi:hypothetical protein